MKRKQDKQGVRQLILGSSRKKTEKEINDEMKSLIQKRKKEAADKLQTFLDKKFAGGLSRGSSESF